MFQTFVIFFFKSGKLGEKRRKLFKIVDCLTYVENYVFLAVFFMFFTPLLSIFKLLLKLIKKSNDVVLYLK